MIKFRSFINEKILKLKHDPIDHFFWKLENR